MTYQPHKQSSNICCNNLLYYALLVVVSIGLSACGGGQAADPLVAAYPLAYVQKPFPTNNNNFEAALDPSPANPSYGSKLKIREAPLVGAKETTITPLICNSGPNAGQPDTWDVKDLEFSDDGSKLLFSALLKPCFTGDMQYWTIYEYTLATGIIHPVIQDTSIALGDDVTPHYLLDGVVIFSSNRNVSTSRVLINQGSAGFTPITEGDDGNGTPPSFKLHVVDRNGFNVKQVTFGTSHDLFPSLMRSGRYSGKVIFSRWDTKGTTDHRMNLYMIDPNGANETYIYGYKSHNTGTNNDPGVIHFTKPVQLNDGRILSIVRHNTGTFNGGDLVAIDINNYVDYNNPIAAGLTSQTQRSLTAGLGSTSASPVGNGGKYYGKFISVAPYYDGTNKAIVSKGDCYVLTGLQPPSPTSEPCNDTNVVGGSLAPPLYNVGVYTLDTNEWRPLGPLPSGFYYSDVAVAQEKSTPNFISSSSTGTHNYGTLHIRNVLTAALKTRLDNVATLDPSIVPKYIQIYKHAYMTSTTTAAEIGVDNARRFKMREIIGYAPIYPDGSVRTRVPSDVPLSFQIVNNKYEVLDHNLDHPTWFTVRADEERTCNGCHETGSTSPHGRYDVETIVNPGTTNAYTATTTVPTPDSFYPALSYPTLTLDSHFPVNFTGTPIDCRVPTQWDGRCRSIINYDTNIHHLWADKGCTTTCHQPTTFTDAMTMITYDTTDGLLDLNTITDPAAAYINVVSSMYTDVDGTTKTRSHIVPGAATSSAFLYDRDINGNIVSTPRFWGAGSHTGRLTDDEIKMITEWIDNGAQYHNHP